jgi:phosphate transport system substrate-binding protein
MRKNKSVLLTLALGALSLAACSQTEASIVVYTRDTTSGTRDGFMTAIDFETAKADDSVLVSGYVEVASNGDMISAVKNDSNGIGYISYSTLSTSGLTGLSYEGIAASETTVLDATYQMTRNFNYITRSTYGSDSVQEIVEAFVAFLSTKDAKATMQEEGGILTIADSDPTWSSIKASYPIATSDNSAVTVKLGGSTSVADMSVALTDEFSPLCGNFVAEHNHTGSGDAYKRTQGTDKDSTSYLDVGFASREFKTSSSEPAADGTTGKMCTDAIVAVINSSNASLTNITAEKLKGIYSGTITKWSELA